MDPESRTAVVTRFGLAAERVRIRSGNGAADPGWSDCCSCSSTGDLARRACTDCPPILRLQWTLASFGIANAGALARRSSWLDPKLPPTVPASERRGLTGGVKAGSASVGWSELPWQGLSLVTTESPHVCSCAAALGRVVLPRHAIPSEQDMASLCASLEHGRPRAGLTQKRSACTWLNGPGCGQRRTPVAFSWNGRSCRGGSSGSGLAV